MKSKNVSKRQKNVTCYQEDVTAFEKAYKRVMEDHESEQYQLPKEAREWWFRTYRERKAFEGE
jgi:hypothetical protein